MDKSIRQLIAVVATSTAIVAAIVLSAKYLGLESAYLDFLQWAQSTGYKGFAITGLLVMLSVVFLVPAIYLTMGAGLLFGVVYGSILVVVATTTGAVIAFAIGRMAAGSVTQKLMRNQSISKIDSVVKKGGWEIIAATRMVPFFPFKLSNYVFGCSSVRLGRYVIGTFICLWPISVFNVYLGSIAGDIMSIGKSSADRTAGEWAVYMTGFGLVVLTLLVTASMAHRKLNA